MNLLRSISSTEHIPAVVAAKWPFFALRAGCCTLLQARCDTADAMHQTKGMT